MNMWRAVLEIFVVIVSVNCAEKPHIVLIIGDDMGWNDVGFHGSNQIPTPNIDALAYNGVILNRFYTQASCTPSRAALLTGNYPIRMGYQGFPLKAGQNRHIPLDMPTLPEKLKTLGYSTHLVGKWHLGYACKAYSPTKRGFDEHFGYWNGYVSYFNYSLSQNGMNGYDLHNNFDTDWASNNKYATDAFTEKSLEIIRNHDESANPLFLMISHLAPHAGYNGTALEVPNVNHTNKKFGYIKDESRRLYADIVNRLDRSVGQIVKALADKKMLENSIIMYISDNGGQTMGLHKNSASNWPLKGLKFTLFEGGVRVVATIYSPKISKKKYVNNDLIHISDLFATFFNIAGGDSLQLPKTDSNDQWRTISENVRGQREELLLDFDEVRNMSAIIGYGGRFKLVNGSFERGIYDDHQGDSGRDNNNLNYNYSAILNSDVNKAILRTAAENPLNVAKIKTLRSSVDYANFCDNSVPDSKSTCTEGCLFDLKEDPCETVNVASLHPDILANLNSRLDMYRQELIPQDASDVDIRADPANFNGVWSNWLENIECSESM